MIEVVMPQLGESVAEGTVTQWHVKPGDAVKREQPLLEVATDKADSDVPSPTDGVVVSVNAAEGDVLPTGGLLCTIDETASVAAGTASGTGASGTGASGTGGASTMPGIVAPPPPPESSPAVSLAAPMSSPASPLSSQGSPLSSQGSPLSSQGSPLSSPSTRQLARERGIDITNVRGSGERGRITHDDIRRAAERPAFTAPPVPPSLPPSVPGAPPSTATFDSTPPAQKRAAASQADEIAQLMNLQPIPGVGFRSYKVPPYRERPGDEIIPFSRRRRITADHMLYSQAVSPHVVTVAEIDLHKTAKLRDQHKGAFKKEGISLTFLTFVAAAVTKGLRESPSLNARVLDDSYALLKDINVGIAIDTPSGLLVANIKNTDKLSVRGIAMSIQEVAGRARNGKITADDLMGTSFTISNPGRKGNLFGGAIISQPNVGILRVGEIKKRPVVVSVDGDDQIAIHPVMYSALSYDHRIVDGVEANKFLWRVSDILANAEFEI